MGIHEAPTPQHWNYFLSIDEDLVRLARYLHFTQDNFNSYSLELVRIFFAASSEVDILAKQICVKIDSKSKADTIVRYREEINPAYPQISEAMVHIPRFGLSLNPWEQWQKKESPLWWKAYNQVKHDRHIHFSEANLKHVLNSVAGLFVLLLFFYHQERENGLLTPDPQLFRAGAPFHVDKMFYAHATIYKL